MDSAFLALTTTQATRDCVPHEEHSTNRSEPFGADTGEPYRPLTVFSFLALHFLH